MARHPFESAIRDGGHEVEAYDEENAFARILRGELPVRRVYESHYALAFHDVEPQASYHVIVVPKGQFRSFDQFTRAAPPEQVRGFWEAVRVAAERLGLGDTGYRLVMNHGPDAHQAVEHMHVHLLGGRDLGPAFGQETRAHTGADQVADAEEERAFRRGAPQGGLKRNSRQQEVARRS